MLTFFHIALYLVLQKLVNIILFFQVSRKPKASLKKPQKNPCCPCESEIRTGRKDHVYEIHRNLLIFCCHDCNVLNDSENNSRIKIYFINCLTILNKQKYLQTACFLYLLNYNYVEIIIMMGFTFFPSREEKFV